MSKKPEDWLEQAARGLDRGLDQPVRHPRRLGHGRAQVRLRPGADQGGRAIVALPPAQHEEARICRRGQAAAWSKDTSRIRSGRRQARTKTQRSQEPQQVR